MGGGWGCTIYIQVVYVKLIDIICNGLHIPVTIHFAAPSTGLDLGNRIAKKYNQNYVIKLIVAYLVCHHRCTMEGS